MNPVIKKLILLVCLVPCTAALYSQTTTAGNSYNPIFEKVYLHTDREQYASGEDIWFKAYLVNAQTGQLLSSSNNLYVELISPDAKLNSRQVIRLDKGLGHGDFKLDDSIAAGHYRIRAYTNWMRNFGDYFVFEKSIQVYSTVEPAGSSPAAIKANTKAKVSPSASSVAVPGNIPSASAVPRIRFFPEGGSMIEGVAGRIAIKAEDAKGKGTAAKGSIRSASGEHLADFSCGANGLGSVQLQPFAGQTYLALGTFSGGTAFNTALPAALLKGYALTLQQQDSLVLVQISTNQATFEELQGRQLELVCRSKGKKLFAAGITLGQLQTRVAIEKSNFTGGISEITLYDNQGRPHSQRLLYTEAAGRVNLSVSTNKSLYKAREQVTLNIRATDQNNQPLKANLSLAAVDAGLSSPSQSSMPAYLNLQSELRGDIENPAQYFDEQNSQRRQQLDLLMMTQGWRDFTWKRLADSVLRISYAMEQGITVSGRVLQKPGGKPVAGANITLSASAAKGNKLFSAQTDSLGRYYIDQVALYGPQSIRLNSKNNKGEKNGVISLDSLFQQPPPIQARQEAYADTASKVLQAALLNRRARISDTIALKEVKITANKRITLRDGVVTSFGYKDEEYTIAKKDTDHTDLMHYLAHYSKGYVDDVEIDDGYGAKALHRLFFYRGPRGVKIFPRIFVNGVESPYTDDEPYVMVHYQNSYFTLRMNQVQKVVIRHMLGSPVTSLISQQGTNAAGVATESAPAISSIRDIYLLYLTLKPGVTERSQPDIMTAQVNGYYQARTFYAPAYPGTGNKQDLRTTIHWAPNITTNDKGEATVTFYNADPKTKVSIITEGVSDKGIPMSIRTGYEVN